MNSGHRGAGGGFQKLVQFTTPMRPIFHCDAKYLALGVGIGQCPPTPEFCVGDTNMHVGIFWRYLTLKFICCVNLHGDLRFFLCGLHTVL